MSDVVLYMGKYQGLHPKDCPPEYIHWLSTKINLKKVHPELYRELVRISNAYTARILQDMEPSPAFGVDTPVLSAAEFCCDLV